MIAGIGLVVWTDVRVEVIWKGHGLMILGKGTSPIEPMTIGLHGFRAKGSWPQQPLGEQHRRLPWLRSHARFKGRAVRYTLRKYAMNLILVNESLMWDARSRTLER